MQYGFNLEGKEHQLHSSGLVSLGGQLPYCLELQTGRLTDILLALDQKSAYNRASLRKKITSWLYLRTRPGFYLEMNEHLHLAYADQRDGHGTQHWWRLFFDDETRDQLERVSHNTTFAPPGMDLPPGNSKQAFRSEKVTREWGGMYLRSEAEVHIAQALEARGLLFFANCRGRISGIGSPVSAPSLTGRLELDFLVFHQGKCMILEVDGQHHQESGQIQRDYVRDRVLLREGIPTARFSAAECLQDAKAVVSEFLALF